MRNSAGEALEAGLQAAVLGAASQLWALLQVKQVRELSVPTMEGSATLKDPGRSTICVLPSHLIGLEQLPKVQCS